jgi:hypothetical protein
MYLRPAAMVSSIPQAVAEGRALRRSTNFLEIVYSFLDMSKSQEAYK